MAWWWKVLVAKLNDLSLGTRGRRGPTPKSCVLTSHKYHYDI